LNFICSITSHASLNHTSIETESPINLFLFFEITNPAVEKSLSDEADVAGIANTRREMK
jgi:hypothetical protein